MKKVFKVLYTLIFSAVALSTVSCSEDIMDSINENVNNPTPDNVPAKFVITDVQNQLAINIIGGDASFYALAYTEQEVGIFSQLYSAEIRSTEPTASSTYNNSWINIYSGLEALSQIAEKCEEGGTDAGSLFNLGISQVMTALYLGTLTDLWGDTPWSDALKIEEGVYQPKLDSQESIYADIIKTLDEAIVNLESGEYGAIPIDQIQDMVYGRYAGISATAPRAAAYVKFAYSLKARYLMRLSKVDPNYDAVLAAVNKGFASSNDDAKVSLFDGSANSSPYNTFYYSRDYMACSASFIEKLTARNDPRVAEIVTSKKTLTDLEGLFNFDGYLDGLAPNGKPIQQQGAYSLPMSSVDGAAPVWFMSYHELMFIKAEALQRGGSNAEAKVALDIAIKAAMVKTSGIGTRVLGQTTISDAAIDEYIANEVAPLFSANPLSEIALQKYFGLYQDGESLEAYHDVRRNIAMGNNVYEFRNSNSDKFPLRYTYGGADVTTNPYIRDAYGDGRYVYTEAVWWAGGTR